MAVSGRQGERTVLTGPVQLSKRILMEPAAVPAAVRAGRGTKPSRLPTVQGSVNSARPA